MDRSKWRTANARRHWRGECCAARDIVDRGWSADILVRLSAKRESPSDPNEDVLPEQQPHEEQPQKNERYREGERSFVGRQPRRVHVVVDKAVHGRTSSISAWHFDQSHQDRHDARTHEQSDRIHSKNHEWFRPKLVALDINQPVT